MYSGPQSKCVLCSNTKVQNVSIDIMTNPWDRLNTVTAYQAHWQCQEHDQRKLHGHLLPHGYVQCRSKVQEEETPFCCLPPLDVTEIPKSSLELVGSTATPGTDQLIGFCKYSPVGLQCIFLCTNAKDLLRKFGHYSTINRVHRLQEDLCDLNTTRWTINIF